MFNYTREQIAATVDLACLKPDATSVDVSICCQKAIRYKCASVCVKPYHVPIAARLLEGFDVGVGTVVGFPHGNSEPTIKALEAAAVVKSGATEFDWVTNIGAIKDGNWEPVVTEFKAMAQICRETGVKCKVILETCYLKENEIYAASHLAALDGVDWVKTSTGFGTDNARVCDVSVMLYATKDFDTEVKASGGIKQYEDAERFLSLGCTRLGSSRIEELMPDWSDNESTSNDNAK
jgi:deoxyribose-phosphate aldolase